ncbi:MAG: c-type cytochrome [Xanthobacteraceae bacterium]
MTASKLPAALRAVVSVLAVAAACGAAPAKPIDYQLPDETAAFRPGPNRDVMLANCAACHSSDFIATQPQGPRFKKEFWQAEVNKMIKVYGAPIDDADVGKIVDYLTATY